MKIIVLYGSGEIGKRNEALRIKKQFSPAEIVRIDFKEFGLKELEMKLVSPTLFETSKRLIVVENTADSLDLQKLSVGDANTTLLLLAGNPRTDSLLLQSGKKMGGVLSSFEGEKELTAFPFLDALIEQKKTAFIELEKLMGEYGGIYVLSMIYYLLRRNLLPPPASDFMRKKIESQKSSYQLLDWINFYRLTLQTEYQIKSGSITEENGICLLVQKFLH